jgi:hypothetical protein
VEIAIGKLKSYKSPGTNQITSELIKAGGQILCSGIRKLICSIRNKEELPQWCEESFIVPSHKKGDETDCNNYNYLLETSRDFGLEINAEKVKYMIVSSSELRTEPEYKDS